MKNVSVIIPSYNNARWLQRCLESCLHQSLLKEVIVVDDSSTDNSWEILSDIKSQYPDLIKIFKNPEKGPNQARNFGFDQSSGEYIQWLDSDDFLLPGKFTVQIEALKRANADIAYCDFRLDFYKDGKHINSQEKKIGSFHDFTEEILKDNWLASHCYLIRRGIAEKLSKEKGWHPETKIGQDREYFTLAALKGAQFVYVPGTFAVYNRWSLTSVSGMDFNKRLELNQLLEERFRLEIKQNSELAIDKKNSYLKILNTHKIKACYYNPKINLKYFINPFEIRWDLIHWKMRMLIPFILVKKSFSLFKSKKVDATKR